MVYSSLEDKMNRRVRKVTRYLADLVLERYGEVSDVCV